MRRFPWVHLLAGAVAGLAVAAVISIIVRAL